MLEVVFKKKKNKNKRRVVNIPAPASLTMGVE
jgi:hypothetical protein